MRLLVQPRMAGSSPVITRILLLTASHRFHNLTTPVGPGSFSAMLLSHASQPCFSAIYLFARGLANLFVPFDSSLSLMLVMCRQRPALCSVLGVAIPYHTILASITGSGSKGVGAASCTTLGTAVFQWRHHWHRRWAQRRSIMDA